ncbi:MAG TPA: hypothetical protein VFN67_17385 [Polyangiales bacterium]|nr:hypothetical protein [Polyangiales bacterium]
MAGYCVCQDISDLQISDVPPQFSLGKSAPAGFGSTRNPRLYLEPVRSEISGLGAIENHCERSALWRSL